MRLYVTNCPSNHSHLLMSCSGGSFGGDASLDDALDPVPMAISPAVSTDEASDLTYAYNTELGHQGRWWRHCLPTLTFPHASTCSPARRFGD